MVNVFQGRMEISGCIMKWMVRHLKIDQRTPELERGGGKKTFGLYR